MRRLVFSLVFPASCIFIAFLCSVFISGCSKKEPTSLAKRSSDASKNKTVEVKQEAYRFKVEGFNKDRKVQWRLIGESANVLEDKVNIKNQILLIANYCLYLFLTTAT